MHIFDMYRLESQIERFENKQNSCNMHITRALTCSEYAEYRVE